MNEGSEPQEFQRYVNNVPLGADSNFAQWILDPTERLNYLEHRLCNERFNFELGKWVSKGNALMNQEGINDFLNIVSEFFDRNTTLSNLTSDKIGQICTELNLALNDLVALNWKRYELEKGKFDLVITITMYPIYMAMKRAEGSGTLDALTKTYQTREVISPGQEQKKGGMFNIFNRSGQQ